MILSYLVEWTWSTSEPCDVFCYTLRKLTGLKGNLRNSKTVPEGTVLVVEELATSFGSMVSYLSIIFVFVFLGVK